MKPDDLDDLEAHFKREETEAKRVFDLARVAKLECNKTLRLHRAELNELFAFAESVNATNLDVRKWYANGPACNDRPGALATFHPVIHRQPDEWLHVYKTAKTLAVELQRWIWLTVGEDHWARILLGHDPKQAQPRDVNGTGPLRDFRGGYCNDQFITSFAPDGTEHFIGAS